MISANRLEYKGYSSVDFDLMTCVAFDSDDGEQQALTKELIYSDSYNGAEKRINGVKYTNEFAPKFTFTKNTFGDFSTEEVRSVLKWLSSGNASFLTVYNDDSNVVHWSALGIWSEIALQKMGNGRVVGITGVFTSAHPYAFSPLYTLETSNNSITINIDTDEPEAAIYPRITITMKSNGNVTLTNTYAVDGVTHVATSEVADNRGGEVITLDGANRIVSSTHQRIFGNNFDWNWLPLYDGTNTITISGDCTVKFEYREIRKIGEL